MNVTTYSATGPREENEDAYRWTGAGGPRIFLLADGMGGAAAGQRAARAAVDAARDSVARSTEPDPGVCLVGATWAAETAVRAVAVAEPHLRGMGSTLVLAWVCDERGEERRRTVYVANVGDSRCYHALYGAGAPYKLVQVTEDHSIAEEAHRAGGMTRAEADRSPVRHVLTRAVGHLDGPEEVDVFVVSVRPGDAHLLCSDGLHGVLVDREIGRLLRDPATDARRLVDEAAGVGLADNTTAVLVRF